MIQQETIEDHYDERGLSRFYSKNRVNPRNKSLSIPQLRRGGINEVRYSTQYWAIVSSSLGHRGLENYIRANIEGSNTPLYVVDNHQHAFFAWCEAILEGAVDEETILLHFDEHPDNVSHSYMVATDNLTDVYNFTCSLWEANFIYPAIYKGLVNTAYWIHPHFRSQDKLATSWSSVSSSFIPQTEPLQKIGMDNCLIDHIIAGEFPSHKLIVDIDLDYFKSFNLSNHPENWDCQTLAKHREANSIDELTEHDVNRLRKVIQRAGLVTVATSPGYIDEADALTALHLLFDPTSSSLPELPTRLLPNLI